LADQPAKIALPGDSETHTDETLTDPPATPVVQLIPISPPSAAAPTRAATSNQQTLSRVLAPVNEQNNVVDGLLTLVEMARRQLLIVSPYFVPGADMKAAFSRAVARGVQVRILTNSLASNDAPLAHAGYARHRKDLLAMGVELYELRSLQTGAEHSTLRSAASQINGSSGASRAMLHSKLMVVDNQLTIVGSMNLDMRSQLQNTEIALLVASRKLSGQAQQHINATLAESAWYVTLGADGKLLWQAPAERDWGDQSTEPDASLPLRMMIHLIGPLAPDHLL
jgi:phosphatidylserine/phosphatidylglycerophosphate/cardiolipin synthase-like enzyme